MLGIVLCAALACGSAGCVWEDFLAGAGLGAAGMSAVEATEESLIETGEDLQAQRVVAVQAVQDANTPEELSLAEKKLAVLDNSLFANAISLKTVQNLKAVAGQETPQGRTDAIATGLIGLGLLALKQWQLMVSNKKKKAMKIGQAKLRIADPEAEKKLFALTGEARTALGVR